MSIPLMKKKCGHPACMRTLYIFYLPGPQTHYCYGCKGVTSYELKNDDGSPWEVDGEEVDDEGDY